MRKFREPILFGLALLLGGAGLDAFCPACAPKLTMPALAQTSELFSPPAEKPAVPVNTESAPRPASEKPLPACLSDIAKATAIEDASLRSAKLRESLIAAQKLGPSSKAMLIDLVHSATPSGRLLAVALLRKIDAAEYQKQVEALKEESGNEKVSFVSPTEHCHYSVSDILSDMASKTPLIKLLPDITAK